MNVLTEAEQYDSCMSTCCPIKAVHFTVHFDQTDKYFWMFGSTDAGIRATKRLKTFSDVKLKRK